MALTYGTPSRSQPPVRSWLPSHQPNEDGPMSEGPAKRRRLRFELRTLFVVVTAVCVLCAWLGWQVKIVQNRRTMRAWVDQNEIIWMGSIEGRYPPPQLSWIRELLGDKLETWPIQFRPDVDLAKVEEFHRLFPEADFWVHNDPPQEKD